MPEYIEREIFINNELIPLVKQLDLCHPKQKKGVLMAIQKLNETPTADVVEVVRCGQCGNYCKNTGECNLYGRHPNENDFCSSGIKEREG